MIKVGITGQSGFIGTHLFNSIGLLRDEFFQIPFDDSFFEDQEKMDRFVKNCDVIIHLAAMNRHHDPEILYETNIRLVVQLISACEATKSLPHIVFASSTQEELDNVYGRSKRQGRGFIEQWALRNNSRCTSFVIPNVYGPFGNPYYNSVVATFCHQLTHQGTPVVEIDAELKLIFVNELARQIIDCVKDSYPAEPGVQRTVVEHTSTIKVSELLHRLALYKTEYIGNAIMPDLKDSFERNLFITFLSYIDHSSFYPRKLNQNTDVRGSFVEMIRSKNGGQVSFSITKPGITRGNHFHTRKAERFIVIKGNARIDLRRVGTDKVISFTLNGGEPSFVDIPIWHTHSITNIGDEDLYTIFWINEFYDSSDPDTYSDFV